MTDSMYSEEEERAEENLWASRLVKRNDDNDLRKYRRDT